MTGGRLDDLLREFRRLRDLAEKAVRQVPESRWTEPLDDESNSIATVMKHVGGNLRSRWTDFLTSDGEKQDRNRDAEFEIGDGDTAAILERWNEGWLRLLETIERLRPEDLEKTVAIRSEPHTVHQAIIRSLGHTASHVGQIVLLARHAAGASWKSLSISRGGSEEFHRKMREGRGMPQSATPPREES